MITGDWIFLLILASAIALVVGYLVGYRRARQAWVVDVEARILSLRDNYTGLYEKVRERDQKQVQQAAADFRSKAQEYLNVRSAGKKASSNAVLNFLAGHLESHEPNNTFDLARFRYIEGVVGFGPDFFDHLSSLPSTATRKEAAARIRELVEQRGA